MTPFFFGSENAQLLGVHHEARRAVGPVRAAVICPPIGQEYIRTNWGLRLLAKQLARKNIHVLRFDFAGHGDSYGSPQDIDSLSLWERDIDLAANWLQTTVGVDKVMLIGLRLGGTLAMNVALDHPAVHSIVAWEPVTCGSVYLQELRRIHRQMTDLWYRPTRTINDNTSEEILGTVYHRRALVEIEKLKFACDECNLPQLIIDLESRLARFNHSEPSLQKAIGVNDEYDWTRFESLESAWLRPQTTRLITSMIDDMFNRLEKFGALDNSQLAEVSG